MTDIAIRIEGLSKRYRIGLEEEMHDTFAAALTDWMTRPVRNFRRLRRLTRFDDGRPGTEDGNPVPSSPSSVPGLPSGEADIIWALKDVSFEVKQGEVVGIIGRNGAGKSTLLKVLSRITHPTSGRVELHGRVSSLLEVGTGFHPELTGRENIYLNGTILGMTKAEIDEKFEEIVDFSGVEKFIDTPVKRYSSGMRVRLAFSVAAHLEPEILLVDEVLAVGDAEFQKKCLGKMGEVAKEGRTVLFVSHNIGAIQNLCARAIMLDQGCIKKDGEATHVVREYIKSFGVGDGMAVLSLDVPRQGSGEAQFQSVELLSPSGEQISALPIGSDLNVRMAIKAQENLGDVEIGVGLFRAEGLRCAGFNSRDLSSWTVNLEAGKTRVVELRINKVNLAPGVYYLNLLLRDRSKKDLDFINQAISFEIVSNPDFHSGRTPKGYNLVFLNVNWA